MKDKKGFLLAEETLKIIIAMICIGFLVYFLVSLYISNKDSKDLELAKASLEHLIKEINSESTEVEIYNPSSSNKFPGGWIIISFPIGNNVKPRSCSNLEWGECLCICKEDAITLTDAGLAKDCEDTGICMESDFDVVSGKIKIENPPLKLNIDDVNQKITR